MSISHREQSPLAIPIQSLRPHTHDEPSAAVPPFEAPAGEAWLVISDREALPPSTPAQWHLSATFPAEPSPGTALVIGVLRVDLERLLREMIVGGGMASLAHEQEQLVAQGYRAALSIIAARVGDRDLTAASVAAELGTSMRTLQRQFSAHGTTVERSIRAARVLHARSLLEDPAYRSLTVSRVAHACGMRDGTALARAFAKENLAPPAAIRAAARRAP